MSDEEELEDFDFNEEDLRRAMNPGYRGGHKMSKEEAMLGIWASKEGYSDSDEDDQFSYRNQKSGLKKGNIDFVGSATSKKPKYDKDDEEENEIYDDKISDYEDDDFGFGKKSNKKKNEMLVEENDSDEDNETRKFQDKKLINQFKNSKIKKTDHRPFASNENKTTNQSQPNHAQTKQSGKQPVLNKKDIKEIGEWEKYTKGIGMKLLQKMGWEKGKGIGKEMQGRALPVEATLRKGKGAVGAYGSESKDIKNKKEMEMVEQEDETEEDVHVSQWKKNKKNKKIEYAHRTPQELLELAATNPEKLKRIEQMLESTETKTSSMTTNKIKIIDMTGKEQRVMHGYESISQITRISKISEIEEKKKMLFDLPELRHNLELIVNMTEDKIITSDKKLKHFEDMIVSLTYEEKRTSERMKAEKEEIDKIESLISIIEKCEKSVKKENVTIDELINIFQDLQQNYADEFIIFNLSQLAIPLMTPVLKRKMDLWDPFDIYMDEDDDDEINSQNAGSHDINYCQTMYSDLKDLLKDTSITDKKSNVNPYHRIVWETWMTAFRKNVFEIDLKNKDYSFKCVDLINRWYKLLPNWIIENIYEQIIMPKLIQQVDEWNPTIDTVPIHSWVLPWLPLLKERLETSLFPQIRYKLANALTHWHPSDISAKAILIPWKPPVFNVTSWDTFMVKNIVPKLQSVIIEEFEINPSQQDLDPWKWIMEWKDLIPLINFIQMLEESFFPKWLKTLCDWLNSKPNYEEVSNWYAEWKTLLGDKLAQHPNIKAKLGQGLMMMSQSVSGVKVSYNIAAQVIKQAPVQTPTPQIDSEALKAKGLQTSTNLSVSTFKDLIEKKASEHNLLFLPVQNRFTKDNKQIYRLGNLNVYIDRNVAFMLQNGEWIPASINEIVQKAL